MIGNTPCFLEYMQFGITACEKSLEELAQYEKTIDSFSNLSLDCKYDEKSLIFIRNVYPFPFSVYLRSDYIIIDLTKVTFNLEATIKKLNLEVENLDLNETYNQKSLQKVIFIASGLRDLFKQRISHITSFTNEIKSDTTYWLPRRWDAQKELNIQAVKKCASCIKILLEGLNLNVLEIQKEKGIQPVIPQRNYSAESLSQSTLCFLPPQPLLSLPSESLSQSCPIFPPVPKPLTLNANPTPLDSEKIATETDNGKDKEKKIMFNPNTYHHFVFCLHPFYKDKKGYEILSCNAEKAQGMSPQNLLLETGKTSISSKLREAECAFKSYEEALEELNLAKAKAEKIEMKGKVNFNIKSAGSSPNLHVKLSLVKDQPIPPLPPGGAPVLTSPSGRGAPPPPGQAPTLSLPKAGGRGAPPPPPMPMAGRGRASPLLIKAKSEKIEKKAKVVALSDDVLILKELLLCESKFEDAKSHLLNVLISEKHFQTLPHTKEDILILYHNFILDAKGLAEYIAPKNVADKKVVDEKAEKIKKIQEGMRAVQSNLTKKKNNENEEIGLHNKMQEANIHVNEGKITVEKHSEIEENYKKETERLEIEKTKLEKELESSMRSLKVTLFLRNNPSAEELLKLANEKIASLKESK